MPRQLELLDLPSLYRHRNDAVALDTTRLLTRGNPLGPVGLLAYLNPAGHVYSAVAHQGTTLFGGVIHTNGDTLAKLLYLAPAAALSHPDLPVLIEHLVAEAGSWGVMHVLAEVDERSEAYRALRRTGFAVYAWQRVWDLSALNAAANGKWRRASEVDLPAMQSLHHQIVPALLAPVEQPPQRAEGLVCCAEGMRGYVNVADGTHGIVMTPLIHPEAIEVAEKMSALPAALPDRRGRSVYLCVRSYQAWLEPVLEDLGALPGDRQAVMVKHLAHLVREEQPVKAAQPAVVAQPSQFAKIQKRKP
jgi:hypothetical protein